MLYGYIKRVNTCTFMSIWLYQLHPQQRCLHDRVTAGCDRSGAAGTGLWLGHPPRKMAGFHGKIMGTSWENTWSAKHQRTKWGTCQPCLMKWSRYSPAQPREFTKIYIYILGGAWASLFGTLCQAYPVLQDYLYIIQNSLYIIQDYL